MNPPRLAFLLAAALTQATTHAMPEPPTLTLQQNGAAVEFSVALDAIYVREPHQAPGQVEPVPPQPDVAAICDLADRRHTPPDHETGLVLVPAIRPGPAATVILTRDVLVKFDRSTDPAVLKNASGADASQTRSFAPGFVTLKFSSLAAAIAAPEKIKDLSGVESAEPVLKRTVAKHETTPASPGPTRAIEKH